jgi:antitoxin (DNA-binding transcriptional repressor) of toxin-antitoxin stability system
MDDHTAEETRIGVTAFKARCLELIEAVAQGKMRRVVLLKHNRPVAEVTAVSAPEDELWGSMAGSVKVAPGVDLTESTGEAWEADG